MPETSDSPSRRRFADRWLKRVVITLVCFPALTGLASAANTTHDSGAVKRATLANGLQVIIVPDKLAPTATTVMTYNVGARQTPPKFPGTAHALEHMMFRGTDSLSASQISAIAAAMGGHFNANTQTEATQYYFSVPAQDVDVALHLHAARMKSAKLSAKDWSEERGAIEKEVGRDLSDPGYVASTKLRAQLFPGTAYAEDGLGTKPSFDKTTAAMLKHFYQTWYAPNNATLVVAGDVDADKTLATIRALFGDIQKKKLPARQPIKLKPIKSKSIHMPTDAGYGLAYLAFRGPGTNNADTYAAARVLAQIMNNPRGRFYSQLVASGASLGASFSLQSMRSAGIAYVAAAFPKNADSDKLVHKMRGVLQTIVKQGVTPAQVQAAKNQLITADAAHRDSIQGLAMRWSRAVAIDRHKSPAAMLDRIKQVDAGQINQLAGRLLAPDNSVLTVLTPTQSKDATTGAGFGGSESFAPSHVGNVSLPSWAAKPLATIKTPKPTLQPVRTRLKNGLQVIVVPAPSTEAVHVYGHVRNAPALETPAGQMGVDSILDRLFDYGTKHRHRRAYQAALDKIGAQSSAGTDFSLTVLPKYFKRGLGLLAEKQLHPALPAKAFPIAQRQVAGSAAGEIESPGFLAHQELRKGLFPAHDPSLAHATPKSVQSLSRADVLDYYNHVFRPDLTTIVVVGNVSPEHVEKTIKTDFGGWAAKGVAPRVDLDPVPANKRYDAHVPDNAKSQDEVTLAQTLALGPSSRAYRALKLGNQVLTGGFYASRLYRELRAKRGLVYTIGSGFDTRRNRTTMVFHYGAEPSKVATAQHIIKTTVSGMADKPVSKHELHQARASLVRQIPLRESSAGQIAGGLLHRIAIGQPLNAPYQAARTYMSLSPEAIQTAFKRWIRPADWVRVVQGPKAGS